MRILLPAVFGMGVILAACSNKPAATTDEMETGAGDIAPPQAEMSEQVAAPAASHRFADWAGEWIGVEGMVLTITPDAPGTYKMSIVPDLETEATVMGRDASDGIAYDWEGGVKTLRAGDGAATGLKWHDGKKNCLIVEEGVGFCRD